MLTISTDIVSLSQTQKEALCGFIMGFPASEVVSVNDSEESDDEFVTIPSFTFEDGGPTDAQVAAAFARAAGGPSQVDPPLVNGPNSLSPRPEPFQDAPTPFANSGTAGLDRNGLPWDERIHASSKAKVADGTWRQKRGVDAGLVTQVEAELKALMGLPAPVARIETTVFPPTTVVGVTEIPSSTVTANLIPPPPPAPSVQPVAKHCDTHDKWFLEFCPICPPPVEHFVIPPPPAPPAPPAQVGDPFTNLLTFASSQIQQKKITMDEVSGIVQAMGVPALPLLRNRPDLLPGVHARISELSAGR